MDSGWLMGLVGDISYRLKLKNIASPVCDLRAKL